MIMESKLFRVVGKNGEIVNEYDVCGGYQIAVEDDNGDFMCYNLSGVYELLSNFIEIAENCNEINNDMKNKIIEAVMWFYFSNGFDE